VSNIQRLTNLRLLDYTVTVNVDPLPISQEIHKEEKEHDRVAGDYASEKKISLLTVMEKKQKKIHALMQGQTIPFRAMFAIRVWDKSRDGLNAKAGAIKNALNSLHIKVFCRHVYDPSGELCGFSGLRLALLASGQDFAFSLKPVSDVVSVAGPG
jgi:hypothetical protein